MHSAYEEGRTSPMGEGLQRGRFQLNIMKKKFLIKTIPYEMQAGGSS